MLNKNKTTWVKRFSSVMAFGFFAFMLYQVLFPAGSSSAAETASATIKVNVAPVLELAVNVSEAQLKDGGASGTTEFIPSSAGTLLTNDVTVAVTTNNASGYTLKVKSSGDSTSMTHSNKNIQTAITSVADESGYSSSAGVSTLAANTWGFKTSGNWFGIKSSEVEVVDGTKTSGLCSTLSTSFTAACSTGTYNTHTVTFGANVTDSLPAGDYSNKVVFSATAKASTN